MVTILTLFKGVLSYLRERVRMSFDSSLGIKPTDEEADYILKLASKQAPDGPPEQHAMQAPARPQHHAKQAPARPQHHATQAPARPQQHATQAPAGPQHQAMGTPARPQQQAMHLRADYDERENSLDPYHSNESFIRRSSLISGLLDFEFEEQVMRLNVGGTLFLTTRSKLRKHPYTRLAALSTHSPHYNRRTHEYYFDRNPTMFASILDLYRINELHLPRNCCGNAALRELEFWNIPAMWISACCWNTIHEALQDERLHKDLMHQDYNSSSSTDQLRQNDLLIKIWRKLYDPDRETDLHTRWNYFITFLLTATIALFFVDSSIECLPHEYYNKYLANTSFPSEKIPARKSRALSILDEAFLGMLIVEMLLKIVCCPYRLKLLKSFTTIVYCLSLILSLINIIVESILTSPEYWSGAHDLDAFYVYSRMVRFMRMVRFFEVLDRNASLRVMWVAFTRCRSELFVLVVVFMVTAIFFGALAYYFEIYRVLSNKDKEGKFAPNLALSLYWAIITMTTVGYGDISPTTPLARFVSGLCAIFGVIVLAMPVAVLTESFQQYNIRQKIRREKRKRQYNFLRQSKFALLDSKTPMNTAVGSGLRSPTNPGTPPANSMASIAMEGLPFRTL